MTDNNNLDSENRNSAVNPSEEIDETNKDKTVSPDQSDESNEFIADIQKAESAVSAGEFAEAKEIYSSLTLQYPHQGEAWLGLAKICFLLENYSETVLAYKKCLEISPAIGVYSKIYPLGVDSPHKLFSLAKELYEKGLFHESAKYADHLVEMQLSPDIRSKVCVLREELQGILFKEWKESAESFKQKSRGINIISSFIIFMFCAALLAGLVYVIINSGKAATIKGGIDEYNNALRDKEDFITNERGGKRVAARFEKVEGIFKDITKKEPDNAEAYYWLARTYQEIQEVNRALSSLGEASNISTDFSQEIEANLTKALELDKNYADAYLHLAQLRISQKKLKDAVELIEKAMQAVDIQYPERNEELKVQRNRTLQICNNLKIVIENQMEQREE